MNIRIRIAAIGLSILAASLFTLRTNRIPISLYASTASSNKESKASAPRAESGNSKPTLTSPADVELASDIDQAIEGSQLASARWGIFVISMRDGRVIYARNGDKLFTPASNMKIYTTAVALDLLGTDYRWRTSVYAQAEPDADGTVEGDLTLYGRGAPDLVSRSKEHPSLVQLADQLYARGVRRVRGNLIGDESYFRGNPLGEGWQWNDVQWYFGAEVSALSIDANEVALNINPASSAGEPASVTLDGSGEYFRVLNNVATLERGAIPTVGIKRGLSDNEVVVWGEFPAGGRGFGARLSVHNPALWAATLFKDILANRGIVVDGEPRTRGFQLAKREGFDPQAAIEVAAVSSNSLGEIAVATNKKSINLNAELILRALGKERGAMAPDPDQHKMRERGDDEAGLAVIHGWLQRAGLTTSNLALHDGSGLSRLNLVTPEVTARLLVAISKASAAGRFRDSLPVAGKDGTLAFRMKTAGGRLVAKTGSLTYDDALSGYATSGQGEDLAFSVICNDATNARNTVAIIDKIGLAIVAHGSSDHQNPSQK